MPVVDWGPDAEGPDVFGVIMRKQFPQSGPRSTEFGKGDTKVVQNHAQRWITVFIRPIVYLHFN